MPDDQLVSVLRNALAEAQKAYELSSEVEVKDRLSYLCGALETTLTLMLPVPEQEQPRRKLIDYIK